MTTNIQFRIDPGTRMDGRKMSPGGVITLPFAARLALGFVKGRAAHLDVVAAGDGVKLTPSRGSGPDAVRSSPRGILRLPRDVYKLLSAKGSSRYRLTIDAKQHEVRLEPAS